MQRISFLRGLGENCRGETLSEPILVSFKSERRHGEKVDYDTQLEIGLNQRDDGTVVIDIHRPDGGSKPYVEISF